jgi:hypothetical protein
MILNGRSISQMSGKRNNIIKARGQQITNKKHQRIAARNVFILFYALFNKIGSKI